MQQRLNDARRWNLAVCARWSGREGIPMRQPVWECFVCRVSAGFNWKVEINRCWCRDQASLMGTASSSMLPLAFSLVSVNLGFFSTLWLRRGDAKCLWPNFTYNWPLRKLLGKRDELLYYLKLKREMNVICHFLGKYSNHKDMCTQAVPQ